MTGSAATRWGGFHAAPASGADPKHTAVPQRDRLMARRQGRPEATGRPAS